MKKFLMRVFGCYDEIERLKNDATRARSEKDYYSKQLYEALDRNEQLQQCIYDAHNDDVQFNFLKVNTVSIERMVISNKKLPATCICYIDNSGKIRDFYLYVSEKKHKELMEDFAKYKDIMPLKA